MDAISSNIFDAEADILKDELILSEITRDADNDIRIEVSMLSEVASEADLIALNRALSLSTSAIDLETEFR